MGWRELLAWWRQMRRDVEGPEPDPERWDNDEGWEALRAERDRKLGRPAAR